VLTTAEDKSIMPKDLSRTIGDIYQTLASGQHLPVFLQIAAPAMYVIRATV
jgi:hypothetical protein